MRSWTVTLMRNGRSQRQWHLRGESVSIGALPGCNVRLPRPAPDLLARIETSPAPSTEIPWEDAVLVVEDVSNLVEAVRTRAQERLDTAAPREICSSSSVFTLTTVALLLMAAIYALFIADQRPYVLRVLANVSAQLDRENLGVLAPELPRLEPSRPHAALPAAQEAHRLPLLASAFGQDLSKIARDAGTPQGGAKAAPSHDISLPDSRLELSAVPLAYPEPDANIYQSPSLSGLFQPG